MKSLARSGVLFLATVAPWSHAAAPDPSLLGCWRATKIVLHTQDGSRTEDASGRCTLRFGEDAYESVCATSRGTATSSYQYRIDRPGFYLATMSGSTFRTSLVGSTREYEYHVDGNRLVTVTTNPKVAPPAAPGAALRVETQAERTPCQ